MNKKEGFKKELKALMIKYQIDIHFSYDSDGDDGIFDEAIE